MTDSPQAALQAALDRDIPITQALGLRVLDWQQRQLSLHLPLAANINHQHSQFGGSLYSAAVLAGWGWLFLRLREAGISDGHLVIQSGQIDYPQPLFDDAIARCLGPADGAWERFEKTWQRHGRARLTLQTTVATAGQATPGVVFSGQYVVHR